MSSIFNRGTVKDYMVIEDTSRLESSRSSFNVMIDSAKLKRDTSRDNSRGSNRMLSSRLEDNLKINRHR